MIETYPNERKLTDLEKISGIENRAMRLRETMEEAKRGIRYHCGKKDPKDGGEDDKIKEVK